MTREERSAQWYAYNRILNWLNAQEELLICRKKLQKTLMEFRPEEVKL